MKNTIREDNQRVIFKEEYLNDNALLQYACDKDNVSVSIRFVENPISGIKEHFLLTTSKKEFLEHQDSLIKINSDRDAIAIFKSYNGNYLLSNIYDAKEHGFTYVDFLDVEFKKKFPEERIDNEFILIKK